LVLGISICVKLMRMERLGKFFGVVMMALSYMPLKAGLGLLWCLYGPSTPAGEFIVQRDGPGAWNLAGRHRVGLAAGGFYLTLQGMKAREAARLR
jgi:hypothetical protein